MPNGNGKGDKEELRKKKCPFLKEWCIKDACGLWAEMFQNRGGVQMKVGMCSYPASILLLSEINQKTQPPQQQQRRIEIPGLRG